MPTMTKDCTPTMNTTPTNAASAMPMKVCSLYFLK